MLPNFLRRCVTSASAISQSTASANWTGAASLQSKFISSKHSVDNVRLFSTSTPPNEQQLIDQLRVKFPNATDIVVADVSGGCGAMFEVFVEAPEFKGMRVVKQHQMVNQALKSEIKEMHGLRISTAAPSDS